MAVDSYKWLPPSLKGFYANMEIPPYDGVPWTPLRRPLREATIALVTTAGINVRGAEPPFDYEREWDHPTWGDPTHRVLPHPLDPQALGMMHLHINHEDPLADPEIALPLRGLQDLVDEGRVGSVAPRHVSVMGYQQAGLEVWRRETAPAIVELLRDQGTDGLILAPV